MEQKVIYALGCFDGVHLGHSALLLACRELAQEKDCAFGAVTFTDHPEGLLQGSAPGLINTVWDKARLLKQYGTDPLVMLPFDQTLMNTPWEDFLQLLVDAHHAAGFVCGTDFRFGRKGLGTAALLAQYCDTHFLSCRLIPQQTMDGIRISSTHIRTLLEQGDVKNANRFLGHPHTLSGRICAGKQLGRTIGFPTANFIYPSQLLSLPYGVYACKMQVEGRQYTAVTNIGVRPTVSGEGVTVESYLLNFSGDLYGKQAELYFYDFIRREKKFSRLAQLQMQINEDVKTVEAIFNCVE